MERLIDKSKKSNRRCGNCEHFPDDRTTDALLQCQKNRRKVYYYNCCYQFEWSSRKAYKQEAQE